MAEVHSDVTRLLIEHSEGSTTAMSRLMPVIYDELHSIARRNRRDERNDHTLNTTALVHEAYERLVKLDRIQWQNRTHFMAIAAGAMKRVLINYAVKRNAQKRGGGNQPVELDESRLLTDQQSEDILALDEALSRLKVLSERQYHVVEYRFFGGLDIEEAAEALGVSSATVKRDWTIARAWLNRELSDTSTILT